MLIAVATSIALRIESQWAVTICQTAFNQETRHSNVPGIAVTKICIVVIFALSAWSLASCSSHKDTVSVSGRPSLATATYCGARVTTPAGSAMALPEPLGKKGAVFTKGVPRLIYPGKDCNSGAKIVVTPTRSANISVLAKDKAGTPSLISLTVLASGTATVSKGSSVTRVPLSVYP